MNRRHKKFQTPIAILTILSMLIVSSTAFAQETNNTDPNAGNSNIYLPLINSGTDNASEQSAAAQRLRIVTKTRSSFSPLMACARTWLKAMPASAPCPPWQNFCAMVPKPATMVC